MPDLTWEAWLVVAGFGLVWIFAVWSITAARRFYCERGRSVRGIRVGAEQLDMHEVEYLRLLNRDLMEMTTVFGRKIAAGYIYKMSNQAIICHYWRYVERGVYIATVNLDEPQPEIVYRAEPVGQVLRVVLLVGLAIVSIIASFGPGALPGVLWFTILVLAGLLYFDHVYEKRHQRRFLRSMMKWAPPDKPLSVTGTVLELPKAS